MALSASAVLCAAAAAAAPSAALTCAPSPSVALGRAPSAARPRLRPIRVDAQTVIGLLRSLQGVNGAPAPGTHKPPQFTFGGWNMAERVDVSRGYRAARIDLVRTHDGYGPGDIDAHFGPPRSTGRFTVPAARNALDIFPRADADPADPRSYRFGPTDRQVSSIVALGAQVIFRLGRSETSTVSPPRDFERYAAIAEHIVLHYNRGWDHGFRFAIRYWEVWNEPDLGKLFWGGTPQQFYRLYAALARAVKRADPVALVGGPALAKPNEPGPYRDGFLEFVRAAQVPLDFYSWHWYTTDTEDPRAFVRIARAVRARLDRFGFRRTLEALDEWNYGLVDPPPADIERAAFVASALIDMQDAPIDLAALYRGDSLFGADGATPNRTGSALIALGRMTDTPLRLRVAGGTDACGFAVEAGRSRDGRTMQIVVSNYAIGEGAPRGYRVTIAQLSPTERYRIERYRISAARSLALVGRTEARAQRSSGALELTAVLPAPGIDLLVIRSAGRQ
ncbi:MAG TPA: hypothetical protein VMU67_11025 [Steroidobacteraceae bacterium]|nr:hypothetical protein [Steroidobacteraceae bacterium]